MKYWPLDRYDSAVLAGAILLLVGVAFFSIPLAVALCGVGLIAAGILGARAYGPHRKTD